MKIHLVLGLVSLIAATALQADDSLQIRYFANSGDDAADGLTPATAWKSLEKLAKDLPAGGEARLRRGDVFYGRVQLKSGLGKDRRTVLTAYGEGAAPEIRAYKIARRDPSVWVPTGTNNLWRIDLGDSRAYEGNRMTADGNVGFIKVDGEIYGRKFFFCQGKPLTRQWDFADDHRYVTVWSERNPAEMAKEIAFAPNFGVVPFRNHIELRGVTVCGTGAHGSNGVGADIRISDCTFREIGGSHLGKPGKGTTRYGNGVECWAGSTDVQVSRCTFAEIYDVGFTMQGGSPARSWEDTHVTDCTFYRCTQAYELWADKCRPGIGMRRCSFQRNRCEDTAHGWAYAVRPDRTNATPLLMYHMNTDTCDVLVKDNVFVNSRGFLIFKAGGLSALPETYRVEGNLIMGPEAAPLAYCVGGDHAAAEADRAKRIRAANRFVPYLPAAAKDAALVRYFSAVGDDAADGLTPATAWKSLEKLAKDLPAGGEARLRRGDVFYGRVQLKAGPDAAHPTVLTAYGEGPAPEVSAYKIARADAWTWAGTNNLWRIDLGDGKSYDGNRMTADGNVGFLKVDGEVFARKRFAKKGHRLEKQWDFMDDDRRLTVWSERNPAEMAKDIRVAVCQGTIPFKDNIELRDIAVRGTGAHGANGVGRHVRIYNCDFHEIGGSCLTGYGDGATRYGNCIECWAGSTDVIVSKCRFSGVYDVAFTMQGSRPAHSWHNVHVTDCTFSNCTQCCEIWTSRCRPGVGMSGCSFAYNTCVDTAYCWGYETRPNKGVSTPLLVYGMETDTVDLTVTGNVFRNSRLGLIYVAGGLGALADGYVIRGNTVVGYTSAQLFHGGGSDPERAARREKKIRAANVFLARDL